MHRLADMVRRGVHSPSSHTPWASIHIKGPTRGGAFSLATFKYYSTVSQYDLTISDHNLQAIQNTIVGLRLMSQLKYDVLFPPVLFSNSPPHLDPTLGRKASQNSRRYNPLISRCASSPIAASLPVPPMFSRTLPRIQALITSSQSFMQLSLGRRNDYDTVIR